MCLIVASVVNNQAVWMKLNTWTRFWGTNFLFYCHKRQSMDSILPIHLLHSSLEYRGKHIQRSSCTHNIYIHSHFLCIRMAVELCRCSTRILLL